MEELKKYKSEISIIIIILVILLVLIIINIGSFYKTVVNSKKYKSATIVEIIPENNIESNINGILKSYEEFQEFKDNHQLGTKKITEDNFNDYDYIYYSLDIDECYEEVEFKQIQIEEEVAVITFNVVMKCGECSQKSHIYLIPIAKNTKINEIKLKYNEEQNQNCEDLIAAKPILYLYPEKETEVTVTFEKENKIITSYPKYHKNWKVIAKPNGDLYDESGKYYYALYWDESIKSEVSFKEGFYVTKDTAIPFLEEKLSIIGLNEREKNEFIMYWLPILERNEKNLVYFELTEEREKNNKIIINPKPDSLLRINMHIKKVNKEIKIPEQKLSSFTRNGFIAVEWAGTIH